MRCSYRVKPAYLPKNDIGGAYDPGSTPNALRCAFGVQVRNRALTSDLMPIRKSLKLVGARTKNIYRRSSRTILDLNPHLPSSSESRIHNTQITFHQHIGLWTSISKHVQLHSPSGSAACRYRCSCESATPLLPSPRYILHSMVQAVGRPDLRLSDYADHRSLPLPLLPGGSLPRPTPSFTMPTGPPLRLLLSPPTPD